MHAVTMAKLVKRLTAIKNQDQVSMLDIGCGTGYSTLLYAQLASTIIESPFEMLGIDFHESFIEHCLIMKGKYPIEGCNL